MRKCVMDIWAGVGFLALAALFGVQLGDLTGVSRVYPEALSIFVALGGMYFVFKGGWCCCVSAMPSEKKPMMARASLGLAWVLFLSWLWAMP